MPARTVKRDHSALVRIVCSGFAGVAFAMTVFASSGAAATNGDFTRIKPERREMIVFDPFRSFTDCLAAAAHPDSMYPGIDPDEVNRCLEANGVL